MLCRRDYAEHIVARFLHQIQSEYYDVNRYVSIEGIYLKHFSDTYQETTSYYLHSRTRHYVFH